MKNPITIVILFLLGLLGYFVPISAQPDPVIPVARFSGAAAGGELPDGWVPLEFMRISKKTDYKLVVDDGRVVLKASSNASASGVIRKIKIDSQKYPLLSWCWKITGIYSKSNINKKKGDDHPARLFVIFGDDTEDFISLRKKQTALSYIWASNASIGTIAPNPYAFQCKMIVVRSGKGELNQWVEEKFNVYEDYKKIFGKEPPMITGVGIMTDSDDTKESTVSFYGDISFKKK